MTKWTGAKAVILLLCGAAVAQTPPAPAARPRNVDPQIAAAVRKVSAAQIEANIKKLAGFHNRNTLSAADPASIAAGRGIGAAREWIKSEFERYSQACGGCLEVKMDSFIQEPADRIPKPTEIVNVYAVLPGTDPENAKRVYLVSGHYDSRNSDTLNIEDEAPGANDDASGVAVSLECARVLSRYKFPATLIFMAVAGEEQGLNGSKHFAKWAKSQGMNVEGVLNNDIVGGNKTPGDTTQDATIVRVFSEGVPTAATEAQLRMMRMVGGESDSPSRQLARYVREVAEKYLPGRTFGPKLVFRRDRYLRGGDHISFNEQGYAAVRFTEYREDYNHQHQNVRTENGTEYGDLPKFVDFQYVANVARLNLATLASLASAPAPPTDVKLLLTLPGGTDLFTAEEVLKMLQGGVTLRRAAVLIRQYGVNFTVSEEIEKQIRAAGGDTELMAVIAKSINTTQSENDSTITWETSPGGLAAGYEVLWRPTTAAEWDNVEPVGNVTAATLSRSRDNVAFAVRAVDKKGHRSLAVLPAVGPKPRF